MKRMLTAILLIMITLTMSATAPQGNKRVIFDEGHGQLFQSGAEGALDLSELAGLFEQAGWIVEKTRGEFTDEVLDGVDALVISGAFKSITGPEIEAIVRYMERGGSLCVMLHIGPPLADLMHTLNVSISNSVIHEYEHIIDGNDLNFNVLDLQDHDLTKGLDQFNVYGGWALLPTGENAKTIARTTGKAWIDLNRDQKADARQAFAVMVAGTMGKGRFVVFADDAIFQNNFLKDNNYQLAKNLVSWL